MHLKLSIVFLTFIIVLNSGQEIPEDEALRLAYRFALRHYRVSPGKGLSKEDMLDIVTVPEREDLLQNASSIMASIPTLDLNNIEFELFERILKDGGYTQRVVDTINNLYKQDPRRMNLLRMLHKT